MRIILITCSVLVMAFTCRKLDPDQTIVVNARVITPNINTQGYTLLEIEDPRPAETYFLCDDPVPAPPAGNYNCRNAIFATNLPDNLKTAGTRISFKGYRSFGRNLIWSSTYAAFDVEIYNIARLP